MARVRAGLVETDLDGPPELIAACAAEIRAKLAKVHVHFHEHGGSQHAHSHDGGHGHPHSKLTGLVPHG